MKAVRLFLAILVFGAFFGPTAPVNAHHSVIAEFDVDKSITVTGVLTKLDWILPHSWIYVDVKAPDGKVERWSFLLPSTFRRQGAAKGYFMLGETLHIT